MIFRALGGHPAHVCQLSSVSGKNLLPMFDTPILTIVKMWTQGCGRSHQRQWLFFRKSWSPMQHGWPWVELVHQAGDDGVYHHSSARPPRESQDQGGDMGADGCLTMVLPEHPVLRVIVVSNRTSEVNQHQSSPTPIMLNDALLRSPWGSKGTRSRRRRFDTNHWLAYHTIWWEKNRHSWATYNS